MSSETRIYVACLAAYNNGKLHGKWIDANQDPEDIQAEVNAMLSESPEPDAEEWAIHDHEGFPDGTIGEHSSFAEVSALAEFLEEHGTLGAAVLKHECGRLSEAKTNLEDRYQGTYQNLEDWAEETLTDQGLFSGVSDTLKNYFDFEKYVDACEMGGDIFTIEYEDGVAVFSNY